ncbi:MAG: glycosyltransferase family 2 protein [Candidatus Obscuribacterales bacterium]|nr:glycosyltransferase family 2 protein [Cyanobacteria bacterium SZAS LIN-5]RTL37691.1 MAG: glycosyltransferase [Candidatus Melainabacteria bacterium]
MILDLSIIVAVYNEDPRNLSLLIERLRTVITGDGLSYEVIFVNDGSKAPTSKALRDIAAQYDYVKLIELSRNFGQQAAITAGIDHAEGQAVINLDSDLQDPPELIPAMVKRWREGYDVVYAQRSSRRDKLGKRLPAYIFYRLLGSVSSVHIPWDTGDFRLMDRKVCNELRNMPERSRFLRGLIPWLGFRQIGIPIDRDAREVGQSTYTLKKLINLALDGILAFSVAPLYLVPIVGGVMFGVGLLALLAWAVTHSSSLLQLDSACIIASIITVAGLQILCTGAVAIYLSKVLDEVRGRPTYVVAHRLGLAFARSGEQSNFERALLDQTT